MANDHVIDVTRTTFEQEVLQRSLQQPVLLDFWADWCQPCRTLGPLLEQLAEEYGGGFVVAKINADQEPELAQALQVQGLPTCLLLREGRPVDGFTGALPEDELRKFLAQHGIEPAGDVPEEAEPEDPDTPEARYQGAMLAIQAAELEAAEERLSGIPEEHELYSGAQRLRDGMTWLSADLPAAPAAAAHLAAAKERFLGDDMPGAMDAILESVAADKSFQEGLARKAMVLCFAVVGEESEELDDYRRRLATLMY